nr:hypothetical protein [Leptolyngbya sp. NK1-12]
MTTLQSNWIVAADAVHGNPYDGATLKEGLKQTDRLTGQRPKQVFVDQGFRSKAHHPEDVEVVIASRGKRPPQTLAEAPECD